MADSPHFVRRTSPCGFTLIEMMIAVAILAILTAVAFPSFLDSVRKGRRAEAFAALAGLQQAQERWRTNEAGYTETLANTALPGSRPNGLGISAATSSGLYTISVDVGSASAIGYKATAIANSGTSQAGDGNCKVLGVQVASGTLKYGSGTSSVDWTATNLDPGKCWAR